MLRRINQVCYRFCSENNKLPPVPTSPTMYESFATKIPKADLEKFMNPMGFLREDEMKDYDFKKEIKDGNMKLDKNGMPPEVGFKVKGPEPTRYGDWERKGRVTDF